MTPLRVGCYQSVTRDAHTLEFLSPRRLLLATATAALLDDTKPLDELTTGAFDAVFFAGGQSPMVTFVENEKVHRVIREFLDAGKVTALVCHATAALLKARGSDGALVVHGKQWTGFADAEEAFADEAVGQRIQPFWIETEARKIEGAPKYSSGSPGM